MLNLEMADANQSNDQRTMTITGKEHVLHCRLNDCELTRVQPEASPESSTHDAEAVPRRPR